MSSSWWDEPIERLVKLWKDGNSFSEIAAALNSEFNLTLSRNACIGKMHRMGFGDTVNYYVRREGKKRNIKAKKTPGPKRVHLKRKRPTWNAQEHVFEPEPEPYYAEGTPMSDLDIPKAQRKTLMALTSGTCKWPVGNPGDADFFFCGARPADHRPYCASHSARAFRATAPRERDPSSIERQRRTMLHKRGLKEAKSKFLDDAA